MPSLRLTHLHMSNDMTAQPRPLAGAAVPAGNVGAPRLARGQETTAPPTLTAWPHAAPLQT